MKIWIVINETMNHDSSYYDVIEVFDNKLDARVTVETGVKDIISNKHLGEDIDVYYDKEIEKLGFNCCKEALVINPIGYYELFRIETFDLKLHDNIQYRRSNMDH